MLLRAISATVFIVVALGCITLGGLPYTLLLTFLGLLSLKEALAFVDDTRYLNHLFFILPLTYYAGHLKNEPLMLGLWLLGSLWGLFKVLQTTAHDLQAKTAQSLTTVFFITTWVVYFPAHAIALRELSLGFAATLLLHGALWATDIMALFGGKFFGKRPLAPAISPKKTREGAIVGFVCALLVGCIWGYQTGYFWQGIFIAGIASVMAQMGDLVESAFKRESGLKDAGNLVPGHGGILDRMDSYLLSSPVVYFLVVYLCP
jgi:phosphatidate cytidylyltransferase